MRLLMHLDQNHLIAQGVEPQSTIRIPLGLGELTPAQRRKLATHFNEVAASVCFPGPASLPVYFKVAEVTEEAARAALLAFLDAPTLPQDMGRVLDPLARDLAGRMAEFSLPHWVSTLELADGRKYEVRVMHLNG